MFPNEWLHLTKIPQLYHIINVGLCSQLPNNYILLVSTRDGVWKNSTEIFFLFQRFLVTQLMFSHTPFKNKYFDYVRIPTSTTTSKEMSSKHDLISFKSVSSITWYILMLVLYQIFNGIYIKWYQISCQVKGISIITLK